MQEEGRCFFDGKLENEKHTNYVQLYSTVVLVMHYRDYAFLYPS